MRGSYAEPARARRIYPFAAPPRGGQGSCGRTNTSCLLPLCFHGLFYQPKRHPAPWYFQRPFTAGADERHISPELHVDRLNLLGGGSETVRADEGLQGRISSDLD